MSIFIFSVSFALVISFLCSLAEATLLSISPAQIARMSENHKNLGIIWQKFKRNIDRPISVILLLNTTAHTIGASVAGAQFDKLYGSEWILVFSLVLTFVMLQYTEIAPKTLGVRHNYKIAMAIGIPINYLVNILAPVLRLLHVLNRPFSRGEVKSNQEVIVDELNSMASFARLSNVISADEEKILLSVPRLSVLRAEQVMIPVEQVVFLKAEDTIDQAFAKAQNDPHTRFPIYAQGNKNLITGYLNFKEMMFIRQTLGGSEPIQPVRPVKFVSPNISGRELLRLFVNEHIHMVIVKHLDLTLGMITVEDVVEELLGDLQDEFDKLPRMIQPINQNKFIVGGGVSIKEVAKKLQLSLPETESNISTWLLSQFGKIPTSGETLKMNDCTFLVRRMRRGKVFEVIISL